MSLLWLSDAPDTSFDRNPAALAVVKALGIKRLLGLEDAAVLNFLTADPDVIRRRQAIFRDLEKHPELDGVLRRLRDYVNDLRELAQKRSMLGRSTEDVLYSFGEVTVFIEMIHEITGAMAELSPESDALLELFDMLNEIAQDKRFSEIADYTEKLTNGTKFARSITVGLNLDATFGVHEAGVVSINDDYFTAGDLFSTIFGTHPPGELRCITPLVGGEKSAGLDQAVYNALNSRLSRSFLRARQVLLEYIQSTVSKVYPLADELLFLRRTNEFLTDIRARGGRLCLPEIADEFTVTKLWNPTLLRKVEYGRIVPNDVSANPDTPILLLTGPNSGGKSVYLRSVGIAAVLFQLGLPIPAREAKMPLFHRFFCHFPTEDTADDSRLVEECRAMREILDELDADSLLLMDESFSGTASAEGAVIAGEVLKTIRDRRAVTVFSTHLHELASRETIEAFNRKSPKIKPLSAAYEEGRRTYRITEQTDSGSSYAYEIAKLYGLQYEEKE